MRDQFLPFAPPCIGLEEAAELLDTLRSNWLTAGPKVKAFESAFGDFVSAPAAVALNSCSAGLHAALHAAGVGAGDAVLTTPLTFASTLHAIEHVGARPVLVDLDPRTLNLDADKALETLAKTPEAKAVLPVHYAGQPCRLDSLIEVCLERDLALIEDAAHALPAREGDRAIGSIAHPDLVCFTSFSFYATKNLTTGEGGMLTGHAEGIEKARTFAHHGLSTPGWQRDASAGSWDYEVTECGFKYNMSDLQAAIGLRQLEKLPGFHDRRVQIAARYSAAFDTSDALEIPRQRSGSQHAWHLYVLRLNLECLTIDRNQFLAQLRARNIGASVHFKPVHMQPYYRDRYHWEAQSMPTALSVWPRLLSIPIYPHMSDADVESVIEAVQDILAVHRR